MNSRYGLLLALLPAVVLAVACTQQSPPELPVRQPDILSHFPETQSGVVLDERFTGTEQVEDWTGKFQAAGGYRVTFACQSDVANQQYFLKIEQGSNVNEGWHLNSCDKGKFIHCDSEGSKKDKTYQVWVHVPTGTEWAIRAELNTGAVARQECKAS